MNNFELSSFLQNIYEDYKKYTSSISTNVMASSFECVQLFINLCENSKPSRVMDMGSGFSSVALRRYKKICGYDIEIVSVDTDILWLNKTTSFLKELNLSVDNLYGINDFIKTNHGIFDLILYDMGHYQNGTRQQWIPFVINECIHSNSSILFDDTNNIHYFLFIMEYLSTTCQFTMTNTRPITNDQFGRYSMLFNNISLLHNKII